MADISIAFGNTNLTAGKTRDLVFITRDTAGELQDASTAQALNALALSPPPDMLLNSLDDTLSYGVYVGTGNAHVGFLKVATQSYAATFAGMLGWEPRMADNLVPSMNPSYKRAALDRLRDKAFIDERIGGVDARVLRDNDGVLLIAYMIIGKKTLVVTGGEEAFREILLLAAQKAAP